MFVFFMNHVPVIFLISIAFLVIWAITSKLWKARKTWPFILISVLWLFLGFNEVFQQAINNDIRIDLLLIPPLVILVSIILIITEIILIWPRHYYNY